MTKWGRLGTLAFTLLGGAAFAGSGASAGVGGPPYEVEEIEEEEVLPATPVDPVDEEAVAPVEVDGQPMLPGEVEEIDDHDDGSLISDEHRYKKEEQEELRELTDDEGTGNTAELEEIETEDVTIVKRDRGGLNRGPYVMIGGGVDGYTGGLSNDLNAGASWGAVAGIDGGRLGFELGYTGAANEIDSGLGNIGSGADVVRNSGQAAVKLNLTKTALHPYVMGGIGIERYTVRNGQDLGFSNDTSGFIPASAGLRWNIGSVFTADARFSYDFMFDDEFAPGDVGGNRMQGMLTLGATY